MVIECNEKVGKDAIDWMLFWVSHKYIYIYIYGEREREVLKLYYYLKKNIEIQ